MDLCTRHHIFAFLLGVAFTVVVYYPSSHRIKQDLPKPLPQLDQHHQQQSFSKKYELSRRKSRASHIDMWRHFTAQMKDLSEKTNISFSDLVSSVREHHIETMVSIEQVRLNDGFDWLRIEEAKNVSMLIQKKLEKLQNPVNCSEAKFLVCSRKGSGIGFGSLMHTILYCLAAAFASYRVMLLNAELLNTLHADKHFKPLSKTCSIEQLPLAKIVWPQGTAERVVKVSYNKLLLSDHQLGMPPYLPRDLADRIIRFSPDPVAWFTSQFMLYVMRPNQQFQSEMQATLAQLRSTKDPLPAIHVRRTDKLINRDDYFFNIEEYMYYVEEFFAIEEARQGRKLARRVFVATDEPDVIYQMKHKYINYEIVANATKAKSSEIPKYRLTPDALHGIITDVHILANSDFLVCTMSSNVCGLAYELRLANSNRFYELDTMVSLDYKWHVIKLIDGINLNIIASHDRSKTEHNDASEMTFNKGDVIKMCSSRETTCGVNLRTKQRGSFLMASFDQQYPVSDKYPPFT